MAKKKIVTELTSLDSVSLIIKANDGDNEAIDILEKRYKENPTFFLCVGDLAENAQTIRMNQMFGDKKQGIKLAIKKKLKSIVNQIAGENPSPIEVLLAERIAMCWLDVQDQESRYAMIKDGTLKLYEYHSRMIERAHNRHLSAIKALAQVRRLQVPVFQVNIGDKQVNIAGTEGPSPTQTGMPEIK